MGECHYYSSMPDVMSSSSAAAATAGASSKQQTSFTWSTPFFDIEFVDIRTSKRRSSRTAVHSGWRGSLIIWQPTVEVASNFGANKPLRARIRLPSIRVVLAAFYPPKLMTLSIPPPLGRWAIRPAAAGAATQPADEEENGLIFMADSRDSCVGAAAAPRMFAGENNKSLPCMHAGLLAADRAMPELNIPSGRRLVRTDAAASDLGYSPH